MSSLAYWSYLRVRLEHLYYIEEVYCQTSVYTSFGSPKRVVHVQIN